MAILTNINGKFSVSDAGAVTFNNAFTFPTADGTANYVLKTNGSGQLSWAPDNNDGDITGSGTANTVTKFTGAKTIGDGPITFSSNDSTFAGSITGTRAFFNSGTTNVVATFTSTDGTATLQCADPTGNVEFGASGNNFVVQPAGGVAQLTVGSSTSTFAGDLGIGGSPSHPLDVKGADTNNATIARFYSNTGTRGSFVINNGTGISPTAFIGTAGGSEQLSIGTNSAEAIRIDGSQNVGIGLTDTSSVKLGVSGNSGLPATSGTTQTGLLRLKASNNATLDMGCDHTTAHGWLQVTDVSSLSTEYSLLLQPNGGNVGIGIDTPQTLLNVNSLSGTTYPTLGTASGVIALSINELHGMYLGVDGPSGNGWIQAMREDASATAYNLILQPSGGNVGIGTTSPTTFSGYTTVAINNATQGGILELQSNGTSSLRLACSTTDSALWEPRNVPVLFATNNTERMRIDSSGNVGIGGTPSTFANYTNVTIKGGSSGSNLDFKNSSGTRVAAIVSNPSSDFGIETNEATPILFKTNGSERMRITSGGNVAIGGTLGTDSQFRVELKPAATILAGLRIGYNSTSNNYFDGDNQYFRNGLGSAIRMLIDSSGNSSFYGTIKSFSTGAAHLILNGDTNNSGDTGEVDAIIDLLGDGNPGIYGYRINTENWSGQTALNFQEYLNGSYTSRLFISKDGNVGIGVTSPSSKLTVYGGGSTTSTLELRGGAAGNDNATVSTQQSMTFQIGSAGASGRSFVFNKGGLGYSQGTNLASINDSGTFTATGDVVAYSDERLKSDIKTLDGSKVYNMRGVSFVKDNKQSSGVIAQELEKIAPELVNNDNEYKGVAYGNLTGYLIEAIKELKAEIEELKKYKCDCKK